LDPTQIPPAKRTSPLSFLKVYQSVEVWFSSYGTFRRKETCLHQYVSNMR
jgi:hypothetical protein